MLIELKGQKSASRSISKTDVSLQSNNPIVLDQKNDSLHLAFAALHFNTIRVSIQEESLSALETIEVSIFHSHYFAVVLGKGSRIYVSGEVLFLIEAKLVSQVIVGNGEFQATLAVLISIHNISLFVAVCEFQLKGLFANKAIQIVIFSALQTVVIFILNTVQLIRNQFTDIGLKVVSHITLLTSVHILVLHAVVYDVDGVAVGGLVELLGSDLTGITLIRSSGAVNLTVTDVEVKDTGSVAQIVPVFAQFTEVLVHLISQTVLNGSQLTGVVQNIVPCFTELTHEIQALNSGCRVIDFAFVNHWKTLQFIGSEEGSLFAFGTVVLVGGQQNTRLDLHVGPSNTRGGSLQKQSIVASNTRSVGRLAIILFTVSHGINSNAFGGGLEVEPVITFNALLEGFVRFAIGNKVLGVFLTDVVAQIVSRLAFETGLVIGKVQAVGDFSGNAELLIVHWLTFEVLKDLVGIYS